MLKECDYCDYDTCVALKELGYKGSGDEGCRHGVYEGDGINYFYDDLDNSKTIPQECLRVHLYFAQKWLREEKKLHITIFSQSQESWQYRITKPHQKLEDGLYGEDFASYEEALFEGIKNTINFLKENNGLV